MNAAGVTASAPGKLILCGEHAVVYRRPALVAAVDRRLTARLTVPAGEPAAADPEAPVRLSVPVLDLETTTTWRRIHHHATASRRRWRAWADESGTPRPFSEVGPDAPDHLVKVALGEAAAALGEVEGGGPPLDVHIDSDLPTGCGFGSSAAAAVALVAGYLRLRGAGLPRRRLEELALEVERRQHGSPSGVDGATVLHGGFIWAEGDGAGELAFHPFVAGSDALPRLAVLDTGRPAEGTGEVVAEVRRRWRAQRPRFEELWDEMEAATRAFRALLEGGAEPPGGDGHPDADLATLIRRCQRVLEEIGVVPAAVRGLVRRVEEAGGAAKVSGAGSLAGPGAGTLLVHHPDPAALDALAAGLRLAGAPLRRFPVRLGGPGLRVEATSHEMQETP